MFMKELLEEARVKITTMCFQLNISDFGKDSECIRGGSFSKMNYLLQSLDNRYQYLCVLIDLSIWVVRNSRRIKEVEEAVGLDLLGDRPHAALALVLLLLLHLLHRQVLPLLPVNGTTGALKDLRALYTG